MAVSPNKSRGRRAVPQRRESGCAYYEVQPGIMVVGSRFPGSEISGGHSILYPNLRLRVPQNITAAKSNFFCDNSRMRSLLILLAATTALAQSARQTQLSNTTASLRGVSAVSQDIAWASGTRGTYLRTIDAGRHWIPAQVPDAAGQHWHLQFTNSNPKAFFDSIAFWDPTRGVVLGDPITDESGQLKFQLLITTDGKTWTPIPSSPLPSALEGEG